MKNEGMRILCPYENRENSGLGHPYAKDMATLKRRVEQLWFEHYSRARGLPDTSGFEHVFMGEVTSEK